MKSDRAASTPWDAVLTIGSVARATGIPANTIRTWERRYGFPVAARTESGQRLYAAELVPHLKLIAKALDAGHRPRQILALSFGDLQGLLGVAPPLAATAPQVPGTWIAATRQLDGAALSAELAREIARVGALRFAVERVAPFLQWIGEAWERGELSVHEEHFASSHVRSALDDSWRALAPAGPPTVVCATLPGELHDLGVWMAAVAVASGGRRPLPLAGETPVAEIAAAARSIDADLVAISLSVHAAGPAAKAHLDALVRALPEVPIWVGGAGAPESHDGVIVERDLRRLAE